jgi:hypothetical protein
LQPAEELLGFCEKRQDATSQVSEKLLGSGKKCQGTTSVVPHMPQK